MVSLRQRVGSCPFWVSSSQRGLLRSCGRCSRTSIHCRLLYFLSVTLSLLLTVVCSILPSVTCTLVSQLHHVSRQPSPRRPSPSPYPSYLNLFLSFLPNNQFHILYINPASPLTLSALLHAIPNNSKFISDKISGLEKKQGKLHSDSRLCFY